MKNILFILLLSFNFAFMPPPVEEYPIVILGGGVSALTSATYVARGGIKPVVLTGPILGGAITQSHCVQNWPGELGISGIDLIEKMRHQTEINGARLLSEEVVSVDFSTHPFTITTKELYQNNTKKIKAQACIIALGSNPNLLGVSGENEYWSRGVYSCAVCDGALYRDGVVAVVGGGDGALSEAQYLSNIAKKVYIIVRKGEFRTVEKLRAQEIVSRSNVEVIYHTTVSEIQGNEEELTHLVLENQGDHTVHNLTVDALFLAIGSKPNTALFQNQLELDESGYIVLKKNQQTSVSGVFAAGDIVDPEFKQAVSGAGDAAKAALQALKYLTAERAPIIPISSRGTAPTVVEIRDKKHLAKELNRWNGGPVFVEFHAEWCVPCRTFAPTYSSWAKEFQGRIKFLKVDIEKVSDVAKSYRVRGVPTLVVLNGGTEIKRFVGRELFALIPKMDALKEEPIQSPVDPQIFVR